MEGSCKHRVSYNSRNFLTSCEYVTFSSKTLFQGVWLQLVFSTVYMCESMNGMMSTGKDPCILNFTNFSLLSSCWDCYIPWTGSWLGFTDRFEPGVQEKIPCSYRESKLSPSVPTYQSTKVPYKWIYSYNYWILVDWRTLNQLWELYSAERDREIIGNRSR